MIQPRREDLVAFIHVAASDILVLLFIRFISIVDPLNLAHHFIGDCQ